MFSFRTTSLLEQPDLVLKNGRLGLLCNHTAWHPEYGEYLFETLAKRGNLKRVFLPEHGLFGELQDQIKLDKLNVYDSLGLNGVEFVSLYGTDENSLTAQKELITDLDALIVELQDVGARYYTYNSTLYNLFRLLKKEDINISVYIVDHLNPAGRQVEGTMLEGEYTSFIGIEGLPHRHGLTIGEMSSLFYSEANAKFPLHIISANASLITKDLLPWSIPPSPNIPGLFTCFFYCGQCLWEGTNVSEGRGTTRPFEQFGAPYMESLINYNKRNGLMSWNDPENPLYDQGVYIRWQRFIPTFHKYKDQSCFGFQLLLNPGMQYHSLSHALRTMRFLKDNCPEFEFRPGKYEVGNDKKAIELLVGDSVLLMYLNGECDWDVTKEYIKIEEQKWIRKAKKYLLYDEQLCRVK